MSTQYLPAYASMSPYASAESNVYGSGNAVSNAFSQNNVYNEYATSPFSAYSGYASPAYASAYSSGADASALASAGGYQGATAIANSYPTYSTGLQNLGINIGLGGLQGNLASQPVSLPDCNTSQGDGGQSLMMLMMILLLSGGLGGNNQSSGSSNNDSSTNDNSDTSSSTPATTTTPTTSSGTVWGDPHFTYDGKNWDVMFKGTANILTDKNVEFNATAQDIDHNNTSYITNAGIMVKDASGNNQDIQWNQGGTPTLNGQPIQQGQTYSFNTVVKGQTVKATATFDGTNLTVNTGGYTIKITNQGNHFDQAMTVNQLPDGSTGYDTPDGLWGTNIVDPKNGQTGEGAMGQGVVDNVNNYMVNGLFSTDFAKNKFN